MYYVAKRTSCPCTVRRAQEKIVQFSTTVILLERAEACRNRLLILAITLGEVERHGRFEDSDRNVNQWIIEIQGGGLMIWGSLKGFSLFVFFTNKA